MREPRRTRPEALIGLADQALADARWLLERGSLRGALNRAYYAAFYAASALLAAEGLTVSKHSGVLSLFDREFVLRGRMSREHGRAFHRLFEDRSDADYDEFCDFEPATAERAVESAADLISDARALLADMTGN